MKCVARFALLSIALVMTGPTHAEPLPGSEWQPTALHGEDFTPINEVFIRFDADGTYFGNAGCNSIRGRYVTNESAVLLSPAAATMMACPADIAQQEYDFIQALMAVRSFERDGKNLGLSSADETVILKMQQRGAD